MKYKTEQEEFWASNFGDIYIDRNNEKTCMPSKIALWTKILQCSCDINTILEFGSNIGLNLKAIKMIRPHITGGGIEINAKAANILRNDCFLNKSIKVIEQSILEYECQKKYDMAFTFGVLIHINPCELVSVYSKLYESSSKYIMLCKYYSPYPVKINYRGNENKLFKRDFAGEIMQTYSVLKLVDYGFVYHNDNNFPDDDFTWFLMQK